MVLTRSRTVSPSQHSPLAPVGADAAQDGNVTPPVTDQSVSPPVQGAPTQMLSPSSTMPLAEAAAPTPIIMTDHHIQQLISALRVPAPPSTASAMGSHSNFARCSARFDGAQGTDVIAFIEAVEIYKECVSMDDGIALRGLPMLLTGLAGTWWQGVKHTVLSWTDAVQLLRQTYGPRLPPHKIYRELFSKEQAEEKVDVFVCKARALLAQLPPNTLSEDVQLDMVYGLLNRRIRAKVARSSFSSFAELLDRARIVEDLFDEEHQRAPAPPVKNKPTPTTVSSGSAARPPGSTQSPDSNDTKKPKSRCAYCRRFGHTKEECQKGKKKLETQERNTRTESTPNITCFGCGTPGVIRSNCPTCKAEPIPSTSTAFQSVSTVGSTQIDLRMRPRLNIEILGLTGSALIDTGARQSIASESLSAVFKARGQVFDLVKTNIKLADGSTRLQIVNTTKVDVTVQGVVIPTLFVILPGATDSLLGMNFIRDAGMILDFNRNMYTLKSTHRYFNLSYETADPAGDVAAVSSIDLRDDEGASFSATDRELLNTLLRKNPDIFQPGGAPTTFAVHRICTGEHTPVAVPPYRVTPVKKQVMKKEIERMLEEEIIEEAESEWGSPVVLLPKGTPGEWRFAIDYRNLNALTKTDKYPLPVMDDILFSTKANAVMSTIDLKAGYWQIEVHPDDRDKTSFVTPFGTFRFRRMPFGLKNAPATFQRMIDRFKAGLKDITVVAYLDDILVISPDFHTHLRDLQQVFDRLRLFKLRANRKKCVFGRDKVTYLGHVVSAKGIEPDPAKVDTILRREPPTDLKELKTFLQTCSWFRKFIPEFSKISEPLTILTRKNQVWLWEEPQRRSFEELKTRLASAPILRQPDYDQPFVLRTDASAYAIGAVLMQGPDTHSERPIEYASRLLTSAERNYSTTEREALAVVWGLEKFRGYIEGAQVRIGTDHQPLKWLLSLKTPSGRLARWALKIQSFNLDVEYTPGRINVVADTLSRPSDSTNPMCNVCPVTMDLPHRDPTEIRDAQQADPDCKKIIDAFEDADSSHATPWTDKGYYMAQGIVYRADPEGEIEEPLLVLPESMQVGVLQRLHDAPTAGHPGIERTLLKLKERYYFPNMRTIVERYIKACDLCQRYKPTNLKPAGLLQTPAPQQRFEVLAMDLFGPLPEGPNGERWIYLIEDTASRWVEIFPLVDATAEACSKVLIEEVFLRYGLPRRIVSDNGVQFVSAVMQKAMLAFDVHQSLTPLYHPEANPAERKNREMKLMLSILLHADADHRDWPSKVPVVRFALNNAPNQGTGRSAAYLTFAREMRAPVHLVDDIRGVVDSHNYVGQITPYLSRFADNLEKVSLKIKEQQERRKVYADHSRRPGPNFSVGDRVWVETHIQSSATKGITHKFSPRRDGPYVINKVVSPTSYEVVGNDGVVKGKYHTSALSPYRGDEVTLKTTKRRGRARVVKPVKVAKPPPGRIGDLEGESVAHSSNSERAHSRRRERRLPARLENYILD